MPNAPENEAPTPHDHASRPFMVIEFTKQGRTAALDEALSWLAAAAAEFPLKTFILCQIVATAEPAATTTITQHRL